MSTLPKDFPLATLEPAQVRAALDLKMISDAAITRSAWDAALAVSESEVPDAAIRLLRALEDHARATETQ
ncbi:MAG TPA: hypothetical protein VNT53_00650 [Pseudolysinimonas sp.]|nr:hypothetical protein [Pseudolysinimonas sp.]